MLEYEVREEHFHAYGHSSLQSNRLPRIADRTWMTYCDESGQLVCDGIHGWTEEKEYDPYYWSYSRPFALGFQIPEQMSMENGG